jgi:hypothetical protein
LVGAALGPVAAVFNHRTSALILRYLAAR